MTEIFISLAVGIVVGFGAGVIVANRTASKAEAALVASYEAIVGRLESKVTEARSRVAKRRQLSSWSN